MNKAIAISELGDSQQAMEHYDRAIKVYKRLVNQEGHRERRRILPTAT